MESLLCIILLYFNLLYYKTISFFNPSTAPSYQIIFKADDFRGLHKNIKKLDKIIEKENIRISWGIIGKSMESPSNEYLLYLKEKSADDHYHFFNHGYFHYCDHKENDKSEFRVATTQQIISLQKTQDLVKNKAGIVLDAFGAPCNYINKNTEKALNKFDEIEYWYFGLPSKNKTTIQHNINIEKRVGHPDIDFLRNNFKNKKGDESIIALQIHPYMWRSTDFLQFRVCVAYLKSLGVKFITPKEL